jgi:hypothetical protein
MGIADLKKHVEENTYYGITIYIEKTMGQNNHG